MTLTPTSEAVAKFALSVAAAVAVSGILGGVTLYGRLSSLEARLQAVEKYNQARWAEVNRRLSRIEDKLDDLREEGRRRRWEAQP